MMRSSLPGSGFPARIVAVLALAAMFTGAASQNCLATYRPVTVDMNEEVYNNQGEVEIEMFRLDVNYLELTTLNGSDVFVEPMGCPLASDGTMTHRRPKRTLTLGCADPNDANNCPDEATFWSDPLQYACGETTNWYGDTIMDCAVEDRNQQYWDASPPNVCCPVDKPYFYVFDEDVKPYFYVFDEDVGSDNYLKRRRLLQEGTSEPTKPPPPRKTPLGFKEKERHKREMGLSNTQQHGEPAGARRRLSQESDYNGGFGSGDYDYDHEGYDGDGDHHEGDDDDYIGGWEEETLVGICSAQELPTIPSDYWSNGIDWSEEDFTPNSDMEDSLAFKELGLTTLKDLYFLFDQDAAEMIDGLTFGYTPGCDAWSPTIPLPPFGKDVVSSYFAHLHNNPVPGNDQINSIRKLSPFSSAKSKKDTDGVCKMVVSLRDLPEVEGEIMKIDGVNFSCLQAAYEIVPDAYVALDAYTALARTTGSVPALGANVTVSIRNLADNVVTEYSVLPTFSSWASLKAKLDKRNDDAMWDWSGTPPECGHMTRNREQGKVTPGETGCSRATPAVGRPEDARENAFESMLENKIGFASLGKRVSVKTGKESEDDAWFTPANFDPEKGEVCEFAVYGLKDEDGNDVCAESIEVPRARGFCDFHDFKSVADDILSLIDQADAKITTTSSTDYLVHTGKDVWVECMDIFKKSSIEGSTKTVSRVTDECVKDLPEGVWDYWLLCSEYAAEWYPDVYDPTNAYCLDPCCNLDLQSSMCCMPQEVTYSVPAPAFDFSSFSDTCIVSDARAKVADGADAAGIVSDANPQDAMDAATKIFELTLHPEECLKKNDAVSEVVTNIQSDLSCCLKAVIGEFDWQTNRFASKQPCNGAGDCLSGSCIATDENTNPDPSGACWPNRKTFTNACAVTPAADASTAIAECLDAKLMDREKTDVTYGAARTSMKVLLGGSVKASFAEVGATILEQSSYQTCEGPDGWKYNPDNYCQNYDYQTGTCGEQFCETAEECKAMCLAATACNWGPDVYDSTVGDWGEWRRRTSAECLAADKSSNFCAMTNDWGGVEDISVAGTCAYEGYVYKGASYWDPDTLTWQWQHKNVTDSVCSAIDTGLTAIDVEWSWDGEKKCGFTTGTMASDKNQCLDACTGTNGFQPPKMNSCFKTPVDGKCDSTGWFTQLRDDPTVDRNSWPWEIPFPKVCVADFWGPGGIYEQAAAADPDGDAWSSSTEATAKWSITLTTTSPDIDGTYDLRDASWAQNVAGHTEWWRGLSFTTDANAEAVCTELGADGYMVEDDGSQNCGENRCWLKTITTEQACSDFSSNSTATAQADFGYTDWRSSYKGNTGVCFASPKWSATGYSTWSDGTDAIAKRKTLCANLTGTFYLGRQYTEGKMDDATKCSGEYCSVLGPRFNADNALCDSIGGQCKNSEGCYGCRAPWWGEVSGFEPSDGVCYKAGVSSASNCSNTYVTDLKICVDEDAASQSACSDTWATCADIDPDDCRNTTAVVADATSVRAYASAKMKCRREKQQKFCTTKAQCEDESGSCWGPQLRDSICTYDETTYTHACRVVDNACIVGVNETNPYMCKGSPACEYEWGCWDDERDHFGTYCVDYTHASEATCDAADGEWVSTNITSQKEFCLSDTECSGGRSAWGNVWERDQTECEMCGGTMYSWGQWNSGNWIIPSMLSGGREYKSRAMEQVNSWASQIDEWKVKDLVRDIETQLMNDAQVSFARCMYGELGQNIEGLASECGGADSQQKFEAKTKTISTSNATMNAGIAGTNADSSGNSMTYSNTTFNTTDGKQGKIGTGVGSDGPNKGKVVSRRRASSRRLVEAATVDAAACWSKVRNANDKLVGQLLGDCVALQVSDNVVLQSSVELCLSTKTSREIAADYTVDGFAIRTTTAEKEFKYTPVSGLDVTAVGVKLCAKVSDVNTLFCPVKLASTWATASNDIGSTNCEATNTLVGLQETSKAKAAAVVSIDAAQDQAFMTCATGGDCSAAQAIVGVGKGPPPPPPSSPPPPSPPPPSAAAPTFSVFVAAFIAVLATLIA